MFQIEMVSEQFRETFINLRPIKNDAIRKQKKN